MKDTPAITPNFELIGKIVLANLAFSKKTLVRLPLPLEVLMERPFPTRHRVKLQRNLHSVLEHPHSSSAPPNFSPDPFASFFGGIMPATVFVEPFLRFMVRDRRRSRPPRGRPPVGVSLLMGAYAE